MDTPGTISAHKQEVCKNLTPLGAKLFKFVEFEDNENLVAEIHKHPIGALVISITGIFIALIIAVATILLALHIDNFGVNIGDSGPVKAALTGGGLLLALLALAMTAISVAIYRNNVIFITSEKISEVAYLSIFNRRVTQLGMGQVEDVTFTQKGIFPRLFNYGSIVIESAGKLENYTFSMLPNPDFYTQEIIKSHEQYIDIHGN